MSRRDEGEDYEQDQRQPGAMVPRGNAAGTVARRGFGTEELETRAETAAAIMGAQQEAMVKARFIMALQRPRDWEDVRVKLLKACERPGFADGYLDPGVRDKSKAVGAAWYNKPIGEGVQGFSIRFAEEVIRTMGNLDVQSLTLYDDLDKRIVSVTVLDLESNVAFPTPLVIEKTVERKKVGRGTEVIRTRINSYGDTLYVIAATDDEVAQKQASLTSKAIRTSVLRLLPGDIAAVCRKRILEIRHGDVAKDPEKYKRQVVDGFAGLNVLPSGLKDYLGHDLAQATPAEIQDLRDLFGAIKDGKTTWVEALEEAKEARGEGGNGENDQGAGKSPTPTGKLTETLRNKRASAAVSKPATKPTESTPPAEDIEEGEEIIGDEAKPSTREPGEEPEEGELTPEDSKRADILAAIERLGDLGKRDVAGDVLELYGEAQLKPSRTDEETVALIPVPNLANVLKRLEKKIVELSPKRK